MVLEATDDTDWPPRIGRHLVNTAGESSSNKGGDKTLLALRALLKLLSNVWLDDCGAVLNCASVSQYDMTRKWWVKVAHVFWRSLGAFEVPSA